MNGGSAGMEEDKAERQGLDEDKPLVASGRYGVYVLAFSQFDGSSSRAIEKTHQVRQCVRVCSWFE